MGLVVDTVTLSAFDDLRDQLSNVRAIVFTGDGRHEMRMFPKPDPPERGLLLKVEAVGMCGSDVAQLNGRLMVGNAVFPVVPGHETIGRVESIGPGGDWNVEEGDRVAVDEVLRCGTCRQCRAASTRCERLMIYGYSFPADDGVGLWGGFGEYMAILPGTNLVKATQRMPAEELTLFEPLANAINWSTIAGVTPGDTVVVQGPGHQGLCCVVAARMAGAAEVIVTGTSRDSFRLEAALKVGGTQIIDVDTTDPIERVAEITEGAMADVVMDLADGTTATVPLAIQLSGRGGQVLLAGLKHGKPVEGLISDQIVSKMLTISGGAGATPETMRRAVHLLGAGRVPTKELLGEVYSMDDVDTAMAALQRKIPDKDSIRVGLKLT